jgi:hypothetical protein
MDERRLLRAIRARVGALMVKEAVAAGRITAAQV